MLLNTIIVEDEPLSRAFLNSLLTAYCPEIKIIASVATESDAIEAIEKLNPDLVFLDIELQTGTGFNVVKNLTHTDFQIIFTTGLDDNAIKTIKISGVNYLQKPVDIESLKDIIQVVLRKINTSFVEVTLNNLIETINNHNIPIKLMIEEAGATDFIVIRNIVFMETNEAGCKFFIKGGMQKISVKSLQDYAVLLHEYDFLRIHNRYVININEITKITNEPAATVIMTDGSIIPLSEKKKEELLRIMQKENLIE